jgi:hypothetical protein
VDPTLVTEGGAVGAPTLGFARKRPRRPRVRREPIDLERIAAQFAEFADQPGAEPAAEPRAAVAAPVVAPERAPIALGPATNEQQILRALEAEVERRSDRETTAGPPPAPEPAPLTVVLTEDEPRAVADEPPATDPFGIREVAPIVGEPARAPAPDTAEPIARPTMSVGLPLEQVRAWLEQVQEDLRKVEARVQYLQAEQTRLQGQHQLVAELISSSTPV